LGGGIDIWFCLLYLCGVKLKTFRFMKKILGYRLVKPEYEGAAAKIAGFSDGKLPVWWDSINYQEGSNTYLLFKKAGVLDLWFEPVYEEDEVRDTLIAFCEHHGIMFFSGGLFSDCVPIEEAIDKWLNSKK